MHVINGDRMYSSLFSPPHPKVYFLALSFPFPFRLIRSLVVAVSNVALQLLRGLFSSFLVFRVSEEGPYMLR